MPRIKGDNLHDTAARVDAEYLRKDQSLDEEYPLLGSMI